MIKKFVVIGHITHDLEPYNNFGGGVSYSGITAKKLGLEVTIVTKAPKHHLYLSKFQQIGINIINISSHLNTITTFKAIYDTKGDRIHYVLEQQEPLLNKEIKKLPNEIFENSAILVATVLNEVSPSAIPFLSKFGTVSVTPQGYFREITPNGLQLNKEPTNNFLENMKNAEIIILSKEDLSFKNGFSNTFWEKIKNNCKIAILTNGKHGAIIAKRGNKEIKIKSFKLFPDEEKDFSGSGDVFATAFILAYSKVKDLRLAGTFASLYAALKITAKSGVGIESIPSKKDVIEFIDNNLERVNPFLEKNKVDLEIFKNTVNLFSFPYKKTCYNQKMDSYKEQGASIIKAEFKTLDIPPNNKVLIPKDVNLVIPQNSGLDPKDLHFLVNILWEEKYLENVPSEYRDFFKSVDLHARTTDVHTAICCQYVKELIGATGKPVDEKIIYMGLILHDNGWSKLTNREIAQSLGYSGLKLSSEAVKPKEKHAIIGAEIARNLLNQASSFALTEDQKQKIVDAVRYHDQPWRLKEGKNIPLEVQLICDLDHLWSFTHLNFWQDTVRKSVIPTEYLHNLNQDLDEYFLTDVGKQKAKTLLSERETEVEQWENIK